MDEMKYIFINLMGLFLQIRDCIRTRKSQVFLKIKRIQMKLQMI